MAATALTDAGAPSNRNSPQIPHIDFVFLQNSRIFKRVAGDRSRLPRNP
jgi:hypothetical protein